MSSNVGTSCNATVSVQMICNQSDVSSNGGKQYYDGVSVCGRGKRERMEGEEVVWG